MKVDNLFFEWNRNFVQPSTNRKFSSYSTQKNELNVVVMKTSVVDESTQTEVQETNEGTYTSEDLQQIEELLKNPEQLQQIQIETKHQKEINDSFLERIFE